jgi:hypothetical protein
VNIHEVNEHLTIALQALAKKQVSGPIDDLSAGFIRHLLFRAGARQPLTTKETRWIEKLAGVKGPPESYPMDAAKVITILQKAEASRLKDPRLLLKGPGRIFGGDDYVVSLGEGLADPSSYQVGSAYEIPMVHVGWLRQGRHSAATTAIGVIEDGKYTPSYSVGHRIVDVLGRLCIDPDTTLAEMGHLTGHCACCGLSLKDPKSTALGYGPVCAEKFGLKRGKSKTKQAATAE